MGVEDLVDDGFDRLLAAARAGGEWAWAELYRELSPAVLGYLRAQGALEPEDMLGEVFLQVVRDLARFEGGERELRAWVLTVAHNRLVDDRRRRARRPLEQATEDVPETLEALADGEEEALDAIAKQRVLRMLGQLSPDQRSVLLLRIVGDLTVDQVAEALGKRPGAVKALQRRGLAALSKQISREGVTL